MRIFGRGVRCGGVMLAALAGAGCGDDDSAQPDAFVGSDAGTDGGRMIDAGRDTGPRPVDTGPGDTGPGDTGPGDTGPGDTGPADTGLGDTGPADALMTDGGGGLPEDVVRALESACNRISMCYPEEYATPDACVMEIEPYLSEYAETYGVECARAYALYIACVYEPSCDVIMDGDAWDMHVETNCADEAATVRTECE